MRFHREWPIAQFWALQKKSAELFAAENLVLARVESITRRALPGVALDLRFERDGMALTIPNIFIDELAMISKLRDVCIWPEAVAHQLSDAKLAALEAYLYPWLEFAITGRGANEECFECFGDDAFRTRFAEARKARCLGAAPLVLTASTLMLAQYAGRFAQGASLACASDHVQAGILLSRDVLATQFAGIAAPARELFAWWYGTTLPHADATAKPATLLLGAGLPQEVACGVNARIIDTVPHAGAEKINVVAPRAVDDIFRVGELASSELGLYVKAPKTVPAEPVLAVPHVVGGSSGHIVMLIRGNAIDTPGADVEEAQGLAGALRAEGFTVDLCTEVYPEVLARAGIVHGFGLQDPEALNTAIELTKEQGTPFVLTPFFEDPSLDGRWGIRASRALVGAFADETEIERMLTQLADRQVEVDGVSAQSRIDDGFDGLRRELLRRADVVTVTGSSERDAIQRFSGRRRRTLEIATLVACETEIAPVTHLVPDARFVLIDGNADGRQNLGLLMRALRPLDLLTVVIAPPVDRRLVRLIAAESRLSNIVLPYVRPAEREALYGQAAVYVDAAWHGDGSHRIMHAAAHGCQIVVSRSRHLPAAIAGEAIRIDPASQKSISTGIAEAWQRSRSTQSKKGAPSNAQFATAALSAYVAAYAQASEHLGQQVVHP